MGRVFVLFSLFDRLLDLDSFLSRHLILLKVVDNIVLVFNIHELWFLTIECSLDIHLLQYFLFPFELSFDILLWSHLVVSTLLIVVLYFTDFFDFIYGWLAYVFDGSIEGKDDAVEEGDDNEDLDDEGDTEEDTAHFVVVRDGGALGDAFCGCTPELE